MAQETGHHCLLGSLRDTVVSIRHWLAHGTPLAPVAQEVAEVRIGLGFTILK